MCLTPAITCLSVTFDNDNGCHLYELYLRVPGIMGFPDRCMEIYRKPVFGWCYCHASLAEEEVEDQRGSHLPTVTREQGGAGPGARV